jgi:hypothetical protein
MRKIHVKRQADAHFTLCGMWMKDGFVVLPEIKGIDDALLCKMCRMAFKVEGSKVRAASKRGESSAARFRLS